MMLIRQVLLSIVGIGILAPMGALYASPVTFDYAGTCSTGCALFGLSPGASVSGFLTIDSSFIPGTVPNSDFTSLGFTFGSTSWKTANIVGSASTIFVSGPAINNGVGLLADNSTWGLAIFPQGFSTTSGTGASIVGDMLVFPEGTFNSLGSTAVAGSVGHWAVATPEPAYFPLVGAGSAGCWLAARRRKKQTIRC